MKIIKTTIAEFSEWAASKDGFYETEDVCNCPMARFAKEKYGFKNPSAYTTYVEEGGTEMKLCFDRNIYRFIGCGIQAYPNLVNRLKSEVYAEGVVNG